MMTSLLHNEWMKQCFKITVCWRKFSWHEAEILFFLGFFVQWVYSIAVFVIGFVVNCFRGFPPFLPLAMVGGAVSAAGLNILAWRKNCWSHFTNQDFNACSSVNHLRGANTSEEVKLKLNNIFFLLNADFFGYRIANSEIFAATYGEFWGISSTIRYLFLRRLFPGSMAAVPLMKNLGLSVGMMLWGDVQVCSVLIFLSTFDDIRHLTTNFLREVICNRFNPV